jgi:hypothetical protein
MKKIKNILNLFQRNYSKEKLRVFTVNGAMDQDAKEHYFFVDPTETNKKELIPLIQNTFCFTVRMKI